MSANDDILAAVARSAVSGPLMEAELFSLTGHGRLRSRSYDRWFYVGCDPNDQSTCVWSLGRGNDGTVVLTFNGDHHTVTKDYFILEPEGILITKFRLYGGDGRYLGIGPWDSDLPWPHYPMVALPAQGTDPRAILWFLAIHRVHVPGLQLPHTTLTAAEIRDAYASAGLSASAEDVNRLAAQIGGGR